MAKVIAYCRVSTDKQEIEGTSLESQQAACIAKAQELAGPDDELVVMRETFSGLTLERPELTKLRDWARQGQVKAVVTYSCDRLARDGLHLLLIIDEVEKSGAQVVFVTEPHTNTPEGQLLTYVRGWASKLEALKIKERTVRGRKQRARNGRLPANGKLYGYLYMKGKGESRGIRIPDVDKAKIVQNIFNWYINDGLSLEGIRKRLRSEGIPSPFNSPLWTRMALARLLSNKAYTGETVIKWQFGGLDENITIPGATPAIIDLQTYEAAQERLRLNKEFAKRRGKRDYLLRGLLFCECGRRMVGHYLKGHRYYQCMKGRLDEKLHCSRTVRADTLEQGVWDKIQTCLSNPKMILGEIEKQQDNKALVQMEKDLVTKQARLKALSQNEAIIARKIMQGLMSENVADAALRQGQKDRAELERDIATLSGQIEASQHWSKIDVDTLCRAIMNTLVSPRFEDKRLTLEALGTRITVGKQEVKVSVALPIAELNSAFEYQPL